MRAPDDFTELIGIDQPIVLAPMAGGITTPELVAAVSNAGALGALGAHMLGPDQIRAAVSRIRSLTDRPFAVNFLVAPFGGASGDPGQATEFLNRFRDELGLEHASPPAGPPPWILDAQLEVLEEERVPVWSFALGLNEELIARGHAAGARVMGMVTTVAEAMALEAAGVDAVVAQGAEAGGHRSTFDLGPSGEPALVGTLALVPQVVDAVNVPVIAAGGIMDGRGLVAAFALGASAVQLGTRFILAAESGVPDAYRQRLIDAVETDTVVTTALTGRPTRTVRNRLVDAWLEDGPEPLPWMTQAMAAMDIYVAAMGRGDADLFPLQAGQGLRLARRVQSAAEIVEEVLAEADGVRERLR